MDFVNSCNLPLYRVEVSLVDSWMVEGVRLEGGGRCDKFQMRIHSSLVSAIAAAFRCSSSSSSSFFGFNYKKMNRPSTAKLYNRQNVIITIIMVRDVDGCRCNRSTGRLKRLCVLADRYAQDVGDGSAATTRSSSRSTIPNRLRPR